MSRRIYQNYHPNVAESPLPDGTSARVLQMFDHDDNTLHEFPMSAAQAAELAGMLTGQKIKTATVADIAGLRTSGR